jgi:hypothetical protein
MSKLLRSFTCAGLAMLVAALMVVVSAGLVPTTARADGPGDWLGQAFASQGGSRAEGAARRRGSNGVQVASLGDSYAPKPSFGPSLSGGVTWVAGNSCLDSTLRGVIADVAASYGRVTVSSTCRSRGHNARVGGAKRSHHLTGDATDFRVHGNWGSAYAFLKSHAGVGGLKHYGGGLFHIDTGARRSW